MGIIIGKFTKKKSTYDVLEKLENQITSIEEFGRSTEQWRNKIIGRFLLLAVLLYVILALLLYFYYNKISSDQRLIYIIPVVAFPLIIWIIKKFMTWYYSRKIQKNEKKLIKLREEKKKILDNVMETETYKVAKKILDKFGNEPTKVPLLSLSGSTPITSKDKSIVPSTLRTNPTGLRQRTVGPPTIRSRLSYGSSVDPSTPYPERTFIQPATSALRPPAQYQATPRQAVAGLTTPRQAIAGPLTPVRVPGTPMPLPRSILPRERSVLDKMIHYLIGDGPSNRYALICQRCSMHNGMAFKEDFEYLSFHCCYCSHFNPSKKQRPTGPKLESVASETKTTADSTSDSDKDTLESDEEVLSEPLARGDSPEAERNSDFDKLSDIDPKEIQVAGTGSRDTAHPETAERSRESAERSREGTERSRDDSERSQEGPERSRELPSDYDPDLNPFVEEVGQSPMEVDATDPHAEASTLDANEA